MNRVGWISIGILVMFLIALAIFNNNSNGDKDLASVVWNEQMTKGKTDAPNIIIEYTDITCPHCADYHNAAEEGAFDRDYIDSGKARMEIRTTSLLSNVNSVRAGETAYCAADQGKFFEYYDKIVKQFTKDYFDKGIGISPTSPKVPKLEDQYYYDAAKDGGLDVDAMKSCLADGKMTAKVNQATQKAINMGVTGVPAFDINNGKYRGSGFGGGYSTVEQMMRAGGVN